VRVLYLCHRIPYPPNKGDKIRAFHQLRAMAARHEVDLFTLTDEGVNPAHRAALAEFCHGVTVVPLNPLWARLRSLPFLFSGKALTLPYFYSAELAAEIRKALLMRSYDRIFVYCSAMAQYVEQIDQIPVILDLVDVDSDKWTQYASAARLPWSAIYQREGIRLREYEREICEKVSRVLVSTEREAELLRGISPSAPVQVIPNGVGAEFFEGSPALSAAAAPAVVFTGDMSYFPNQEAVIFFALQVLPLIRQSQPDARFLIVGRNPARNVLRLQNIPGVEVTGYVPDVRTYLAQARVSVAPFSIAAGIQNKIIEAMAYGLPVVATSRAIQGLSTSVAEMVETGNSPGELAAKILRLLDDAELARQTGSEGRRRVRADYNWEHALSKVLETLENPGRADMRMAEAHSSV